MLVQGKQEFEACFLAHSPYVIWWVYFGLYPSREASRSRGLPHHTESASPIAPEREPDVVNLLYIGGDDLEEQTTGTSRAGGVETIDLNVLDALSGIEKQRQRLFRRQGYRFCITPLRHFDDRPWPPKRRYTS